MAIDASYFAVGDDWVYRQRDDARSEHVRILAVTRRKNSVRIDVTFVDDPTGRTENVPGSRLRAPWADVDAYDALMANWQRIADISLDDVEQYYADHVFDLLIPEDVAEVHWSPVRNVTEVHDKSRLEEIIRLPVEDVLAAVEWFDHGGSIMLSPAGTLLITEAACRANPIPVLDQVIEEEGRSRYKCKRGGERENPLTREKETTSPEWEYDWYKRWERPRHELLRQWCGHRAVTFQERLLAAEAENHRLDVLVADLIEALKGSGRADMAAYYEREHERDRITAHNARPVVDRPLDPWELPVREIPVRRRWWH